MNKQTPCIPVMLYLSAIMISLLIYLPLHESHMRVSIQARISHLKVGFFDFAIDHDGKFPDSLFEYAQYEHQRKDNWFEGALYMFLLHAPGNPDSQGMRTVDNWSDFALVPGRRLSDPPNAVLLYGRQRCHLGSQTIVVFRDLTMKWMNFESLSEIIN